MLDLYNNIIQKINDNADRFIALGLLPIETIDLYDGQPEAPEGYEFTSPAIFIDYRITWERGANRVKQGTATVELHVLLNPMPGTESWDGRRQEGLEKINFYNLIVELIEGVTADETGMLQLVAEEPRKTDYFNYHLLTFEAPMQRARGQEPQRVNDAKLDLTVTYGQS